MVPFDGVQYFRTLVESFAEIGTHLGVATLQVVIDGLPNVMKQSAASCQSSIQPQLVGDHLAKVGDFEAVAKNVLPVTRAIFQATQQVELFAVQSGDVGLDRRLFACFQAFLFDVVTHLCDELFDTPRMNTPVLDQLGK